MDLSSPYWLASALGLNAAGNTGSNLTSLPPLVIHSMDYFTNPDYLKPKDGEGNVNANFTPKMQPPMTNEVKEEEACLQPVTGKMLDVNDTGQHTVYRLLQCPDVHTQWIDPYNQTVNASQGLDQNQNQSKDLQVQNTFTNTSPSQSQSSFPPFAQHSLQPKAPKTPKTTQKTEKVRRTRFEKWQREGLEAQYFMNDHLTQEIRQCLEKQLNLSGYQIGIWFQNRRYKERKGMLNEHSAQMMLNNQYLESNATSPQDYSSSISSQHSSLSPQSNIPSCEQLETIKERDDNDDPV